MEENSPTNICIFNIFNGVVEGLSHFSETSRVALVALVYAIKPSDDLCIYDTQDLLKGHELRLKEIYSDIHQAWRQEISSALAKQPRGKFLTTGNLNMADLISFGGSSHSLFYQMWFTEHYPDMCSIHPLDLRPNKKILLPLLYLRTDLYLLLTEELK